MEVTCAVEVFQVIKKKKDTILDLHKTERIQVMGVCIAAKIAAGSRSALTTLTELTGRGQGLGADGGILDQHT